MIYCRSKSPSGRDISYFGFSTHLPRKT